MKRILLPLALILPLALVAPKVLPVSAQEEVPEAPPQSEEGADGMSLMRRGAELFLEGIMGEMGSASDDLGDLARRFGPALRSFAEQMGPALDDLFNEVQDWSVYEAPQVLPNGDILIRRRDDAPLYQPDVDRNPDGSVDL